MRFKEAFKSLIIGGVLSALLAFLVNYYILPVPLDTLSNAKGNAINGFLSGGLSSFLGILVFTSAKNKKTLEKILKKL